jgi:hypothetical protein
VAVILVSDSGSLLVIVVLSATVDSLDLAAMARCKRR